MRENSGKKRKVSAKKLSERVFIFLFVLTVISGGAVVGDWVSDYREKRFWDEVRSLRETGYGNAEVRGGEVLPEYSRLYKTNKDMVGWLEIEGARIDTPVVQTKDDPEHYLRRDFFGRSYTGGTPFADYRCEIMPRRSYNVIIYGHYTNEDKLFRRLLDYASEGFAKKHSKMRFDTLEERGIYEIAAAFYYDAAGAVLNTPEQNKGTQAHTFYNYIELDSPEGFEKFAQEIESLNIYSAPSGITPEDKLLTIVCCAHEEFSGIKENGRFVVVGRKVGGGEKK